MVHFIWRNDLGGNANGDTDAVLHFPSRWKHCYLLKNLPVWAGGKNNKTTTKHLKFEAGLKMGLSLQRQIQKWEGWFMPSFRAGNTHSRLAARVVDCQMAWRPREKAKCHASAKENHGLKRIIQFQHPHTINNSKQFDDIYCLLEKTSIYCLRQKTAGVNSTWMKQMLRWTFLVWRSCSARWLQIWFVHQTEARLKSNLPSANAGRKVGGWSSTLR